MHRSPKGYLNKYSTAHSTKNWVDQLPSAVSNYNSSYHTTIKMTPNEAEKSGEGRHEIRNTALERS